MRVLTTNREDDILFVMPSEWGQLIATLERALVILGGAGLFAVVFFAPDFVFRSKEGVQFHYFLKGVVVVVVFFAAVLSISRYFRREQWAFDAGRGHFVFTYNPLMGEERQYMIDFDEIEAVDVQTGEWPGQKSELRLLLGEERHPQVLFSVRLGGRSSLLEAGEEIRALLETSGRGEIDVEFDRPRPSP